MRLSLGIKVSISAVLLSFAFVNINANAQKTNAPLIQYSENKTIPKADWETVKSNLAIDNAIKNAFKASNGTRAILIVKNGKIIGEQYSKEFNQNSKFNSYEIATSLSSIITGAAIKDKKINLDSKIINPFWKAENARNNITYRNLLNMTDGLNWNEKTDKDQMLYAKGRENNLEYASKKNQKNKIGEVWNYSTGSATLLNSSLSFNMGPRRIGDPTGKIVYRDYIFNSIFKPLGMQNVAIEFDAAGNFYGGTYFNASAREYARLGLMIMRGGKWGDKEIYTKDYSDFLVTPVNARSAENYGGGFYLAPKDSNNFLQNKDYDAFYAKGSDGQLLIMVPKSDLIVIRLGRLSENMGPQTKYWQDLGAEINKIIEIAK